MDVSVMCEYLIDSVMILVGMGVLVHIYAEQRYQEGIEKGMRMQRKIDRAARRGEFYR